MRIKLKTGPGRGDGFSFWEKKRCHEIEKKYLLGALRERYDKLQGREEGCDLYEITTLWNWMRKIGQEE